jgi:hypothetical protein
LRPHGTSKIYILERLRREGRTDFISAIKADKISALAAAVELGWVNRPPRRGGSHNRAKKREHELRAIAGDTNLFSQLQELWLGPHPTQGSVFNSRDELVQAWTTHRDRVMRQWGNHGRRPQGFYEFEWDGPRPAYAVERSSLWRAGVLSEAERAELEAEWRQEFDAARGGTRERREHYEFHDVPAELVEQWTAQKKKAPVTGAAGAEVR